MNDKDKDKWIGEVASRITDEECDCDCFICTAACFGKGEHCEGCRESESS